MELEGIHYHYPVADTEVLAGIDLAVSSGERIRLRGANGSGKTTVLRLVAGLIERPDKGEIRLHGTNVNNDRSARLRLTAYVDQHAHRGVVDTLTVEENLALAYVASQPWRLRRALNPEVSIFIRNVVERVGLSTELLNASVSTLSGGQRQVVNLLTLLARQKAPDLILMDEPLNNLDDRNIMICQSILDEIHSNGTAVMLVSHADMGNSNEYRNVTLGLDSKELGSVAVLPTTDCRVMDGSENRRGGSQDCVCDGQVMVQKEKL